MKQPERSKMFEVFSTGPFATNGVIDRFPRRIPVARVHGKRMGSLLTVCGMRTASWVKWWDQPFDMRTEDACPNCVRVLQVNDDHETQRDLGERLASR